MPAGIAVRSRRVITAVGASEWQGTRVDYHWPFPSGPLKWTLVSFTTVGAGKRDDDVAELLGAVRCDHAHLALGSGPRQLIRRSPDPPRRAPGVRPSLWISASVVCAGVPACGMTNATVHDLALLDGEPRPCS